MHFGTTSLIKGEGPESLRRTQSTVGGLPPTLTLTHKEGEKQTSCQQALIKMIEEVFELWVIFQVAKLC